MKDAAQRLTADAMVPSARRLRRHGPHELDISDPLRATVLCAIRGAEGSAAFLVNNCRHAAGPGYVCMVPPDSNAIWLGSGFMDYVRLCLPMPYLRARSPLRPFCREDDTLNRIGAAIADTLDDVSSMDASELHAWLTILGCHLTRQFSDGCELSSEQDAEQRLAATVEYIENNLRKALSVPELARYAGMSESQFSARFKQHTSMSPYRFVVARRLALVCELLANESSSLADIAYEARFSSQSHMTRVFGKAFGVSPAAYRRDVRRCAA